MQSRMVMGTVVTIEVVSDAEHSPDADPRSDAIDEAFEWFETITTTCSRFDPASELNQLTEQIGIAVHVSPLLFHAVEFALEVAAESGGAFDPTVGLAMEHYGFAQNYLSGEAMRHAFALDTAVSFRDVVVNPDAGTVRLVRPLVLDLGAVAKGLAVDLARKALEHFDGYAIDAGGDLFLGGRNASDLPWSVGIKHPRHPDQLLGRVRVSDMAVCTSGDYERKNPAATGHHILNPDTRESATQLISVTVVAASAMVADALATAAFVLGPVKGLEFLRAQPVEALLVTPDLQLITTEGMPLV